MGTALRIALAYCVLSGCTRAQPERPIEIAVDAAIAVPTPSAPAPQIVETDSGVREGIRGVRRVPSSGGTFDDNEDPIDAQHGVRKPLNGATAYTLRADTILMLRRTECFGTCPVYSVGVTGDGNVHFAGGGGTVGGYRTASIGRPAAQALLAFLAKKKFHTLHARYIADMTDQPSAHVVLRQGDTFKHVQHEAGNDIEPAIEAIEKEIDRVTGTARWVPKSMSLKQFHGGDDDDDGKRPRVQQNAFPAAAMASMLGEQLHAVERACSAGITRRTPIKTRVSIDDLGHGNGATMIGPINPPKGTDCVERALPRLVFPVASDWNGSEVTFVLGPR